MAFDLQKLALLDQHSAVIPRNWAYVSADDAIAAINTANYFADASDRLLVGDRITVVDSTGAQAIMYVNAVDASAGTADVTDGLVITATDTD